MKSTPCFVVLSIVLAASAGAEVGSFEWPRAVYTQDSAYGGDPTGIEIVGDRLYLSTRQTLAAFDVSDPAAVEFLGASPTSGSTQRMTVSGETAYLVGYHADLSVHDLRDPAVGLPKIGGYAINGSASMLGVGVAGERVFVSGHGTGLQVFDVSFPIAPTLIGQAEHDLGETQYFAGEHIRVVGDLIYLAGHEDDFGAFTVYRDIPGGDPEFVGDYLAPSNGAGNMPRIEINGSIAYVVDTARGVQVFDISDPATPKLVSQPPPVPGVTPPGYIETTRDIALSGDALAAVKPGIFTVFDVSNPTVLAWGGQELRIGVSETNLSVMVTVAGTTAYAADRNNLYIVDFADIAAPVLINTLPLTGREVRDIDVIGDLAYVSDGGISVYDVSDPAAPTEVGRDGVSRYRALSVDGNRAAGWSLYGHDVHLYDLGADGRTPALRSQLDLTQFYRMQLEGDWLWVKHSGGLARYAMFDIDRPGSAGRQTNLVEDIVHFWVDGTTLYGASHEYGLGIYDVSDPSLPALLGTLAGKLLNHFVLDGSMLYAARWDAIGTSTEILTVDVSGSTDPQVVGSLVLPGDVTATGDMSVANGFLFVSRGYSTPNGYIIDVSVPSDPTLVTDQFSKSKIDHLEARDGLLYLANGYLGLQIMDTSLEVPALRYDRVAGLAWDAPSGVRFPIEGSRDLQSWLPLGRWAGDTLDEASDQLPGDTVFFRAAER